MSEQPKARTGNAADPEQVKKAAQADKRDRQRQVEDMRSVLNTVQGRRVVWRYLCECKVFETSFHPSGSQTYFNEGMRNIGLQLLADINESSPEAYQVMLKESKEIPNA